MERLTNFWGNLKKCVECSENSNCYSDHSCHHIADSLAKLRDFEDLEEQNRLLKLPCAVGDTVYIVKGGEVLRNYVVQIHIAQVEAQTFFSCYDDCFGIEQIGKTVFLTREEAETALKELEGREE